MDEQQYHGGFWHNLEFLQSKNKSDCNQSVFLKKKLILFMLIKEQNSSNQSSLLIVPIGFLSGYKLMYPFIYSKSYGCFDF